MLKEDIECHRAHKLIKAIASSEEIELLKDNVVLNTGPQEFGIALLYLNQTIS